MEGVLSGGDRVKLMHRVMRDVAKNNPTLEEIMQARDYLSFRMVAIILRYELKDKYGFERVSHTPRVPSRLN